VRTHPVDKVLDSIATSLLQVCYNQLCVFTCVTVAKTKIECMYFEIEEEDKSI
jgi:hypothetical protein